MANEKGPNIKKKQKCKNCEGKADFGASQATDSHDAPSHIVHRCALDGPSEVSIYPTSF